MVFLYSSIDSIFDSNIANFGIFSVAVLHIDIRFLDFFFNFQDSVENLSFSRTFQY